MVLRPARTAKITARFGRALAAPAFSIPVLLIGAGVLLGKSAVKDGAQCHRVSDAP